MKRRIALLFAMLIAASGMATAQTVYYQTTTTYNVQVSPGVYITFNCDVDEGGMVTLYPSVNQFSYDQWATNLDGTPTDIDFFYGNKKSVIMTEQDHLAIQSRVRQAFNFLEHNELVAIGETKFSINLLFDPVTAVPVEIAFRFRSEHGYRYIHPSFFFRLAMQLLATPIPGITVHPDAQGQNFVGIRWLQGIPE
ncbi:MAG: DUF5043 domain-containing protein [Rikenellaceae bacterium]|nr:DUF5043 domain-containing protein [Rikenellaceae bacterium]